MASDCSRKACNVLASNSYNTTSVLNVPAVNVFTSWMSLATLHQKQPWMTFYGDGFEESNICHLPKLFPFNDVAQTTSFACARLVLSSFSKTTCPQCGDHGTCMCQGTGVHQSPFDFALACNCDTSDDWYGATCSMHCLRDHGTWNAKTQECHCLPHFFTDDCSFKCVHGTFNTKFNACECSEGWDGDDCDTVKVCHPKRRNVIKITSQSSVAMGAVAMGAVAMGAVAMDAPIATGIGQLSLGGNGCNGHGTCIANVCKCDQDYTGVFCQLHCPSCEHGGYCDLNISHAKNGNCICQAGWKGVLCHVSKCATNPDISLQPCSGRGVCTGTSTLKCHCTSKYTGKVCDECSQRNTKAPWCNACKPGYVSPTNNCTTCDTFNGFVRDPKHPGVCVLSSGTSGLSGNELLLVISGAFALGIVVICFLRAVLDPQYKKHQANGGHYNDPVLGYVKLNSAMARMSGSLLHSINSNKSSEPWDDDFLFDFSRLRLGKKIGGGTSGEVFVATWDDATRVAAKRLYAPTNGASAFDRAFRREVSLLSQLHHPNIIQLLGVCEDTTHRNGGGDDGDHRAGSYASSSCCYIVTELCMGSLREAIDDPTFDLTSTLSLHMALQISSGMLYLHEKDVIHRDLKPGNVLVARADSTSQIQVKLCDFGLSRVKNSMATLTAMTAAVGTPAYMAPELFQGNHMIDSVEAGKAVDVFSYSMMVLELFTQERPYINMQFNNSYHLMMRVCDGLRPTIIPDSVVPPAIGALCRKCWHTEPESRPSFEQIVLTLKLLEREQERQQKPQIM
jgi:hypothetical protein